jgi:hypothetical protein
MCTVFQKTGFAIKIETGNQDFWLCVIGMHSTETNGYLRYVMHRIRKTQGKMNHCSIHGIS